MSWLMIMTSCRAMLILLGIIDAGFLFKAVYVTAVYTTDVQLLHCKELDYFIRVCKCSLETIEVVIVGVSPS